MGEAIVITSGKGGVGKTTTTANIGTALAMQGKHVCLVDTDIGLRNLDCVLGLENRVIYDLVDVVEGTCKLRQALIKHKEFSTLFLLPAAQTKDKRAVSPKQMEKLIEEVKREFDYVLIDCPAGIEQGFENAIAGADEAIVVTTPEKSAIRDADRIVGLLETKKKKYPKLIINKIRPHLAKQSESFDVDEIVEILGLDLLGVVPDDEVVLKSQHEGIPTVVRPESRAAIAYRNIARRILGDSIPLMNLNETSGMFSKFRRLLGMK